MIRWTFRIAGALALAWLVFLASPFVALHSLGRAVEERDAKAVSQRVNFRALRLSLSKQVLRAYVEERTGRALDPAQRHLAVEAGMSLAAPLVEKLLTPEAVMDLLDDGWPQSVRTGQGGGSTEREAAASPVAGAPRPIEVAHALRIRSLATAWALFRQSELRGFRNIFMSLPPDRSPEQRFRVRLRLVGTTWKLVDLELPQDTLRRLVAEIPGPTGQSGAAATDSAKIEPADRPQ